MSDDFKNPFLDGSEELPTEPHVYKRRKATSKPETEETSPASAPEETSPKPAFRSTPAASPQPAKPIAAADLNTAPPRKPAIKPSPTARPKPAKAAAPRPIAEPAPQQPAPRPVKATEKDEEVSVAGIALDAIVAAVAIAFTALFLQDVIPFLK